MSFLKKLFGLGGDGGGAAAQAPAQEHNGFTVRAMPYQEGGQWQMCGVISKEINGEVKEHRFIRADRFPGREDAVEFTFAKARQIIDMNGEKIFK
ncbi:MAG TPA: HlyU family transcriptional regulator [Beijerinckiaceae bacterium]|nr:HlyU family transcriptional regulator [Beijerinckiaceae bacterium]